MLSITSRVDRRVEHCHGDVLVFVRDRIEDIKRKSSRLTVRLSWQSPNFMARKETAMEKTDLDISFNLRLQTSTGPVMVLSESLPSPEGVCEPIGIHIRKRHCSRQVRKTVALADAYLLTCS